MCMAGKITFHKQREVEGPRRSGGRTTLQTFYGRQPSFSGCRRQDLERTAGQSRLHNVITVLSAPSEDIFVAAIFLVALQWN